MNDNTPIPPKNSIAWVEYAMLRCDHPWLQNPNEWIDQRGTHWYYCLDEKIEAAFIVPKFYRSEGTTEWLEPAIFPRNIQHVVVPSRIESIPVIGITYKAFCDMPSIETVEFEEGIRFIGWGAFQGCRNLRSIKIPSSVTYIRSHCFHNCEKLYKVLFNQDSKLYGIETSAFENCALEYIDLPDYVWFVESYAFNNNFCTISLSENTQIGDVQKNCRLELRCRNAIKSKILNFFNTL